MKSTDPGSTRSDRESQLEQRLTRVRNFAAVLTVAWMATVLWAGTMDRRITRNASAIQRLRDGGTAESAEAVIRAKQFELVDDAGRVLALMTSVGGRGALITMNAQGRRLVEIASTVDGQGAVIANNAEGQRVVAVGALAGGEGFVTTNDGKGHELVRLGAVNGHGTLTTMNPTGNELVQIGVSANGAGQVYTTNGRDQRLVELGSSTDGISGTAVVFNVSGGAICTMKSDERGVGQVGVWDGYGNGRTMAAAPPPGTEPGQP